MQFELIEVDDCEMSVVRRASVLAQRSPHVKIDQETRQPAVTRGHNPPPPGQNHSRCRDDIVEIGTVAYLGGATYLSAAKYAHFCWLKHHKFMHPFTKNSFTFWGPASPVSLLWILKTPLGRVDMTTFLRDCNNDFLCLPTEYNIRPITTHG